MKCALDYLNYEVVTYIDVINESPTLFPTITFFNLKRSKTNYSLDEILLTCRFNDEPCGLSNFETKYDEFDNVYYQFNSEKNSEHESIPLNKVFRAGKVNAFRIKLFAGLPEDNEIVTDSDFYCNMYTQSEGFHVIVHNNSIDPEYVGGLALIGNDVPIGFETTLLVDRVFDYKQPEPYNNCKSDLNSINSFDSDVFRFMINSTEYSYRQKDCFEYCLTNKIFQECNITIALIRNDIFFIRYSSRDPKRECFKDKYYKYIKTNINELCSKECPLECDSISYKISASLANFPDIIFAKKLIESFKEIKSKYPVGYNITYEDLRKSVLAFNVYYQDLSYTKISQVPRIEIIDLVSNMGGLLGLFIGFSFLSFAELFELILEIIFILLNNKLNVN